MNPNSEQVQILPDAESTARQAGRRLVRLAQEAVVQHNFFTLALSGGSTPRILYTLMATDPELSEGIPWAQTHFFFGDERHVPPGHPDNNYRMVEEALFGKVAIELGQVHRVPTETGNPSEAAAMYETELRRFFETRAGIKAGFPRFDLILLGMGADGHTASLFPGSEGLSETSRWVIANWIEKLQAHRITLTYPVLNNAANILLLVTGDEKAGVIAEVLRGPPAPPRYPVQWVEPTDGTKAWFLDQAAGAKLSRP